MNGDRDHDLQPSQLATTTRSGWPQNWTIKELEEEKIVFSSIEKTSAAPPSARLVPHVHAQKGEKSQCSSFSPYLLLVFSIKTWVAVGCFAFARLIDNPGRFFGLQRAARSFLTGPITHGRSPPSWQGRLREHSPASRF